LGGGSGFGAYDFKDFDSFKFNFRSPQDLFNDFFKSGLFKDEDLSWLSGNRMFSSGFGGFDRSTGSTGGNTFTQTSFSRSNIGLDPFFDRRMDDDFFTGGFGRGTGGGSFSTGKSVSTVTKTVNGKSVTTTTTITRDANGNETKEVKEETDDGRGNRNVRYLTGGPGVTNNYIGN